MKTKLGPHLQDKDHKQPDYFFPSPDEMSFDNPIVGFIHKFGAWSGVNVIMKDGRQSDLPLKNGGGKGYESVTIPLNT